MPRSSELRRTTAVAALVGDPERYLLVSGLGTAAFDCARITDDGDNLFAIDGAMGSAVSVGLGLALAQPQYAVLVVTGDGELLMNLGALATAAVQAPPNLSVLCVDNGVYALTGAQPTHTSSGVDLTAVATACGFPVALTVARESELEHGAEALADASQPVFVRVELAAEPPEKFAFDRDGAAIRRRFRGALGSRVA